MRESTKHQLRIGALAIAVVVMAGSLISVTHRTEHATGSAPSAESASGGVEANGTGPATGADTSSAAAPAQATSADEVIVVSGLRRDAAVALIGEARRQAAAGNFTAAESSLDEAEKTAPRLAETQEARDQLARLKTPEGQFADLVRRARLAVDHDESATAESALEEAAKIRPDAPQIAEVRAALKAAHHKKARREARIEEALDRMREAVGRRDFGAADTALNEAERIDVQDPSVRRARIDLAHAREARR